MPPCIKVPIFGESRTDFSRPKKPMWNFVLPVRYFDLFSCGQFSSMIGCRWSDAIGVVLRMLLQCSDALGFVACAVLLFLLSLRPVPCSCVASAVFGFASFWCGVPLWIQSIAGIFRQLGYPSSFSVAFSDPMSFVLYGSAILAFSASFWIAWPVPILGWPSLWFASYC